MNVKSAIASVPLLRKAWKMLPGPLKLPVLVIGAIYAVYRWRRRDDPQPQQPADERAAA